MRLPAGTLYVKPNFKKINSKKKEEEKKTLVFPFSSLIEIPRVQI